ncbi:hypothetical protein CC85DRAFT_311740 [Cutaneotrichosporon oleaginosum]|uniref:triacylglycerol lipase n=1 Tax=Cutaneotrichosporon oleaginosum TaxID=879819 RepID=A0A0J0XQT3_9TREE|nr:uncharacterized protein CC85DRAFT_311740 [Cutaneotrichosporon oleaginosum]KLT43448.1 hypothetical protein CC85DRAFT_311740 [Cutaneotrichosporon oleaginosum]TXT05339.1 hypothetical protein COLE_06659 [Cutaneotrichosporon oleaginosum]
MRLKALTFALALALPTQAAPAPRQAPGTFVSADDLTGNTDVMIAGASVAYRMRYRTDQYGAAKDALATVYVPAGAGSGPLRVLAYTHGTSGVGRECTVGLKMGWGGRYDAWLGPFLDAGYAVVVPEYGGLGIDDSHPYLDGEETAKSVLDAVRAAHAGAALHPGFVPPLRKEFVVYGGSQGGHTALWVNAIAGWYAPDLRVLGSVGAAVPADVAGSFGLLTPAVPYLPIVAELTAYMGYVLAGLRNAGVDLAQFTELSDAGRAFAHTAATACYQDLVGNTVASGGLVTRPLAGTGLVNAVRAHTTLPVGPLAAPVFLQKGLLDPVSPLSAINAYESQQVAKGTNIFAKVYVSGHALPVQTAADALRWSNGLAW